MKKNLTIGVMSGNVNSPHTLEVMNGVIDAAKELNVNILFFVGAHSSYYFKDYFAKQNRIDFDFQSACVFEYSKLCELDGIIAVHGTLSLYLNDAEIKDFMRCIAGKPTVFLESRIEAENARYIISDNYTGYSQLMDHLINHHGYKKIVHLAGPIGNMDADERRRAYLDAMQKNGFNITPDMIEYGDYSESVHDKVTALLDHNPDADALVCGNDLMALTAYEIIRGREALYYEAVKNNDLAGMRRYKKHIIGGNSEFGIAVAGYDDAAEIANIDPPLTTVAQSPYSHGYMAVNTCIGIMNDPKSTDSISALPKLIIRESCGCEGKRRLQFPIINDFYRKNIDKYAADVASVYVQGLLPAEINETLSDRVYDIVYKLVEKNTRIFNGPDSEKFSANDLFEDAKKFINSEVSNYIPRTAFVAAFSDYIMSLLKTAGEGRQKDMLFTAEAKINDYVYAKVFEETREEISEDRHRTWFMPLISRDMANILDNPERMYEDAMIKMNVLGMGDTYLFLLRDSIEHDRNEKWSCPDELLLVAQTVNGEISTYGIERAPIVSRKNILTSYLSDDGNEYHAVVLNLFSGTRQYGILVSKVGSEDVLAFYHASVQISTALRYAETARAQRRAQRELEKVIREVEDKNEILRSLSEYDQLTGCYNRRGFLERGLNLVRQNVGRHACLVFADLDHLKEINDKYGHSEGDYAIENMAKIIKRALPDSAIIARLGGDEFIALFLLSAGMDAAGIVNNIKEGTSDFNTFSPKSFYVECSAGYAEFECEEATMLEDIMAIADRSLYDAKRKRRQTIVKKKSRI